MYYVTSKRPVNASGRAESNAEPQYEAVDYSQMDESAATASSYADMTGGHSVYGDGVSGSSATAEVDSGGLRRGNRKKSTYGFDGNADESIEI